VVRYQNEIGKRRTFMEIDILVLLFSATLYPIVILVRLHPLSSLIGTYWGRNKVTHQSTQPEKINFALQEGQTIVGVMDTTRTMCFYIGNDAMESKDYE